MSSCSVTSLAPCLLMQQPDKMNFSYDDDILYEMHQTSCPGENGLEDLDI